MVNWGDPIENWTDRARCKLHPEVEWVPPSTNGRSSKMKVEQARLICFGCPVRQECLEAIMAIEAGDASSERYGVFGGLTGAERATVASQRGIPRAPFKRRSRCKVCSSLFIRGLTNCHCKAA